MRLRAPAALLLTATAMLGASGCQRVDQDRDYLRAAVIRTEALARTFEFSQSQQGVTTTVGGSIADDLRYALREEVGGRPAVNEVVYDDALALQIREASELAVLKSDAKIGGSASADLLAGQAAQQIEGGQAAPPAGGVLNSAAISQQTSQVPAALTAGQWVIDTTGASTLTEASIPSDQPVQDPLLQSLQILKYTQTAVDAAFAVVKFNPESISYRPKLDPFPRPASGVDRYDLIPPPLRPRQRGAGAGFGSLQQLPDLTFFRTMSVYVQGGRVIAVRERISPELRLIDPTSNLEARISDYGINLPRHESIPRQGDYLLAAINRQRAFLHQAPIVRRDTWVQFFDLGTPHAIALPYGAVQGALTGLGVPGQVLFETQF